jgi:hypothetical protein
VVEKPGGGPAQENRSRKMPRLDAVCSFCTSGMSVVCMSSMGAALAAAGTAGGASAVGMAGMGATEEG